MSSRRRVVPLLILASAIACAERKPAPTGEIQPIAHIQIDTNRVVEVIGLRFWTVEMIQDSLRRYAPGQSLDAGSVASTLRHALHFADAAVHTNVQVFDENETTQITVAVREPRDSTRVHFAPQVLDTVSRVAEWKAVTSKLGSDDRRLAAVVSRHLRGPLRDVIDSSAKGRPVTSQVGYAFDSREDSLFAAPIVVAIAKRTSPRDFSTALATLERSTSLPDRIAAALILANFPARDSAWHALMKTVVGRQQARDASVAWQALEGMSERAPRPVDWMPVATTIRDILDGTALMSLPAVSTVLARTGAGPRDAKAYLAGGGEMLVAHLESANPDVSEPAHTLLVALRGSDLGTDPEPWRAWIRGL